MGSVKDLEIFTAPTDNNPGKGCFDFSDRYSVFDWGEMPDHIPHKGEALCLITAYFFEKMEKQGIKTHYQGLIENGKTKKLSQLNHPSGKLEVSLVRVIEPEYNDGNYDYSFYNGNVSNCLIPLEIIYRNTLPKHSSFRKRAEKGNIDIKEYGLESLPEPGTALKQAIFDVSTKLEASDRYISWSEAKDISGLSQNEITKTQQLLSKVNQLITQEVEKADLKNLDGKIELAFDSNRNLMVVDAVGTPDECRFDYNGFSISKEAIRKYYRKTKWYQEVTKAKENIDPGWKEKVDKSPEPLPENILTLISQLYMVCANEITGIKWFDNTISFAEIKSQLKNI
jgi:phosphoribosylaminoimidazole-succinocarboxamide synthase